MSDSPYGPSRAAPPAQPTSPVSVGEAFRYAWQGFARNAVPWLLAALVLVVVGSIGQSIERTIRESTDVGMFGFSPAASLVNLVFSVLNLIIGAAIIHAALRTTDGRTVEARDLTTIPNLGQAVLAAVLLSVAIGVGLILLVIPGLVVAVLGMWYLHVAIDTGANAVDALTASARLVRDHPGPSLLFVLAAIGVGLLGLLALGVGVLVAVPLIAIASAFVYRRIAGGPVMVPGSA